MMKNNRKFIVLLSVLLMACNPSIEDVKTENYDELFPFKGIDKPEVSFEDMTLKQCDPEQDLENYPGQEIGVGVRSYKVTLTCKFNGIATDKFVVKYINAQKQLVKLGSYPSDKTLLDVLLSGTEYKITYTVKSGFPMYLSVSGVAEQNSSILTSIEAVSQDGVIVVPKLKFEAYQNLLGPNALRNPYCQYIILP